MKNSGICCDMSHGITGWDRETFACRDGDTGMSKVRKPAGRAISDENGNRSWQWQDAEELDTARVRALGEELSLDSAAPGQDPPPLDPYNRNPAPGEPRPKRRTLDDMRKLSEEIRKTKHWKKDEG
jgi:hypothetical protein